jgi:gamma-glutamylcyclotransferase (GGCT)/AIG2-like uncharacterized protein YtfP
MYYCGFRRRKDSITFLKIFDVFLDWSTILMQVSKFTGRDHPPILSIFVYGSLKRGFLRENAWPRSPRSIQTGVIEAELYDLGPYPGICHPEKRLESPFSQSLPELASFVAGELWTVAADDMAITLKVLDEVEGYEALRGQNEYTRVEVNVLVESGDLIPSYAYYYADQRKLRRHRLIAPSVTVFNQFCAVWPDSVARVPRSFEEEVAFDV